MNLEELDSREKGIYNYYSELIAPLIGMLEVVDEEYPVEILNEIRAIFTHMSRYKLDDSESDLLDAEKHVKRAILDCYKYLCISNKEVLKDFRKSYQDVDFRLANNGEFLPILDKMESEADELFKKAKKTEITKKSKLADGTIVMADIEVLYNMYEKACGKYFEIREYLDKNNDAIKYASVHTTRNEKENKVNFKVTIISIIVTVFSILLTIGVSVASAYGYTIQMLIKSITGG